MRKNRLQTNVIERFADKARRWTAAAPARWDTASGGALRRFLRMTEARKRHILEKLFLDPE